MTENLLEDVDASQLSTETRLLLKAIGSSENRIREEVKSENQKLLQLLENQTKQIECLEKKCTELENKLIVYERKFRKNNIIIFGLQAPQTGILEFVIDKLKELLDIQVLETEVNNINVIKTQNATHIKLEFVSFLKKAFLLANCHKLKGSGIFIANDLCFKDREDRKILQEHQKLARSNNIFAKIVGNKLKIDSDFFTIDQLKNLDFSEKFSPITSENNNVAASSSSVGSEKSVNFAEAFKSLLQDTNKKRKFDLSVVDDLNKAKRSVVPVVSASVRSSERVRNNSKS